jgi:predicted nuclease of predicted toxin-antitoxin system
MIVCDENISADWVELLRKKGYEVVHVAKIMHGISDDEVLDFTRSVNGILITEDKDFRDKLQNQEQLGVSVILIRFKESTRRQIEHVLLRTVAKYYKNPIPCFITIYKQKIKIRNYLL